MGIKLAAIYNVWDADYLLPYSIMSIRDCVDVVIVVYQNQSNYGELYAPSIPSELIDVAIHFQPNLRLGGNANEKEKRNIGLNKARELGCTHFIFMDCDELYQKEEFNYHKSIAINHNASACQMFTYYHSPDVQLDKIEDYYVPFICRLLPETKAGIGNFPVLVDPTRKINTCEGPYIIKHPIMHHYSWVRRDIEQKLRNSSAVGNFKNNIPQIVKDFNSFEITGKVAFFNSGWVRVKNQFGIVL